MGTWVRGYEGARPLLLRCPAALPLFLAVAAALWATGCETTGPVSTDGDGAGGVRLSPRLQRMQRYYPDLAGGRFISLADFETPGQELLFRTVDVHGADTNTQPALSILRSRDETGAGGLKAMLRPGDLVRFDGRRSRELALVRDWQAYPLLIASVFSPAEGLLLAVGIESGSTSVLRWEQVARLANGWNLLRIDVASVGARIHLTDVRAITFHLPESMQDTDLYIDDVVLADNTTDRSSVDTTGGGLYARERGRRLYVGLRDRFEIGFLDGRIVEWRAGGVPRGTRGAPFVQSENLADEDGLGPLPFVVGPAEFTEPQPRAVLPSPTVAEWWSALDAQQLVEASAFRVVVAGGQRADATEAATGGHTWRYVIYPWGSIYVEVTTRLAPEAWAPPSLGYLVSVPVEQGFRYVPPPGAGPAVESTQFVLFSRPGRDMADLLWTWMPDLGRQRAWPDPAARRVRVVAGILPADDEVRSTHLLRIWPWDIDDAPEAAGLASDYRTPAELPVRTGRLVTDASGDQDGDGFNEAEGCYELAPEGGVLRVTFEPGRHVRFDPVLRVHETAHRRCWVYARGRAVDTIGRDAAGNLLIWLERTISAPLAIEVHLGE